MTRLAAAILLVLFASGAEGQEAEVDVAIIFVADVSGSMSPGEIKIVREAHASAMSSGEVLTAIGDGPLGTIAVSYIEFGAHARPGVGWRQIGNAGDAAAFGEAVMALDYPGSNITGATAPGTAFLLALKTFDELPWMTFRRVVDIMGDGREGDRYLVEAREALLAGGVVINALAIMHLANLTGMAYIP